MLSLWVESLRTFPQELNKNTMPLTKKGAKIMSAFKKEYGIKKAKNVFYASINKGKIKGAEKGKKK